MTYWIIKKMTSKTFDIIVAINDDSLIGIKEYGIYTLPWPLLKEDIDFFRIKTTFTENPFNYNAVVIGYNTWTSMPIIYKKNPKRINFVISKDPDSHISNYGEKYISSIDDALAYARVVDCIENIYVIGGATIYDYALRHPLLKNIYLTHIEISYPKENIVEEKIFFPLSIANINALETSGFLIHDENNDKHVFDHGKNIHYRLQKYTTMESFNIEYTNMIKLPRINKPPINLNVVDTDEKQYMDLVKNIIQYGKLKKTRNDITKGIFGYQLRYDLQEGYPLSTVKKSYPKAIFEELMWMIRGQTDAKILQKKGVHIWDKNSSKKYLEKYGLPYEEGDIGPGYGFQMRHYGAEYINCVMDYSGQGIDQLQNCINLIKSDPYSRRIVIDLWNSRDIHKMALPPCHMIYNFGVELYDSVNEAGKRGKLNCHLLQRSWDVLLGWNTTTAALLTYILANHCDLEPGILIHSISDAHLYQTHIDSGAVDELLRRSPRKMPTLKIITKHDHIEDYQYNNLVIENYFPCPSIIAEMVA